MDVAENTANTASTPPISFDQSTPLPPPRRPTSGPPTTYDPYPDIHIRGDADDEGAASNKLWSLYLSKSEKYDERLSESWKGDTEGILVFTGLFSATVSAFIIEAYKSLQPNSGDTAVLLLAQMSQQLGVLTNGSHVPVVTLPTQSSFRPPVSAILVNSLWFSSLVLSLACALSATLMQQWSRRYLQMSRQHSVPRQRARMRTYLWDGVEQFGLTRAVEFIPVLLHVSVFLFFCGLVIFMFPINTTVAYVLLGVVTFFITAYIILTLHPLLWGNSPFSTPLSPFSWYALHIPLYACMSCVETFAAQFSLLSWQTSAIRRRLLPTMRRRLVDGMRGYLPFAAMRLSWEIDFRALTWTLASLNGDQELEQFVDGIPGFLAAGEVNRAKSTVVDSVNIQSKLSPIITAQISRLLHTCAQNNGILGGPARNRRLTICLRAIWAATEFFPNLDDLSLFGDTRLVQTLRTESDPDVALLSRCVGALIARSRVRKILGVFPMPLAMANDRPAPNARNYIASLMDVDPSLFAYWRVLISTAHLANVIGLVRGALPYLRSDSPSAASLKLFWSTLRALVQSVDVARATVQTRLALKTLLDEKIGEVTDNAGSLARVVHELRSLIKQDEYVEQAAPFPLQMRRVKGMVLEEDR